jgi:NADP-reducing hydrogenase subunit HndC
MGTPLRDILALAGRLPAGRSVKALLVGGPSGGLLPADLLDTPYEFEALRSVGAHVGSGSIVAADDRACVVDLARLLTRFCSDEACGKSIPCRIGTRRLFEIGDRVASGRSRPTDLTLLADLSADIVGSALCDHERLSTLPLSSAMRYFRSELDDHILNATCPAGVCHPIAVAAAPVH